MLDHRYRGGSRALARCAPVSSAPRFAPEGLVLGAGTVLLSAEAPRRLRSQKGHEARLLALLSAAYGRAVDPAVLGNIERATKAWNQGEDCLAYMHLAHARLGELPHLHDAVQRLVLVDAFLKAGGSPRAVFAGLKLDAPYIDALEKEYDPAELRVPAGDGKPSGEWTRGGEVAKPPAPSFVPRVGAPAASSLGELAPPAAVALGRFALPLITGAGGAVAAFGLLFIPSPNNIHVEGEVQGVPGLHYAFNRDEAVVQFTYAPPDGTQRTFTAWREGDVVRDVTGQVIGRVLPGDTIAFDLVAIAPDLVKQDEPKLCPLPGPDKISGLKGRAYEDYVKSVVNPPDQRTPTGIGFQLPNPQASGKLVYYDDCQQSTGAMVEAKGPGYARLLQYDWGQDAIAQQFLDQSARQLAAAGSRPVRWYFAEQATADFAREVFRDSGGDRDKIEIVVLPWSRGNQ